MAYYFGPPTGFTPGYYRQILPNPAVFPQYQHSMAGAYPMPPTGLTPDFPQPPTGLTPGYPLQPRAPLTPGFTVHLRAPSVMTPGYYHPPAQYQQVQPQVWPGNPGPAPIYRTGMTPGYGSGWTPVQHVRPGQTAGARSLHQRPQTPATAQRPARPGLTPGREPSYFRSYPGRAGKTPAAARTPTPGLKPSGTPAKPFGTPAKPAPGPSRLREVILNEHSPFKEVTPKDSQQFFTDTLKHLEKLEGQGDRSANAMVEQLREFIEIYFKHDKHQNTGLGAEKRSHDHGHVVKAEKEKHAGKAKIVESSAEPSADATAEGVSDDSFGEDGDTVRKDKR